MKFKLIGVLLLGLTLSVPVMAGEDEIYQAVSRFLTAASMNDAQGHDQFWSEQLTYTSSNGTRFDKAVLMSGMSGTETYTEETAPVWYQAHDLEYDYLSRDHVIAHLRMTALNRSDNSVEEFYITAVLHLPEGSADRWQARSWHVTRRASSS